MKPDMDEHGTRNDSDARTRFGSCLEHGCAHAADHARWSRRDFLAGMGLAAGATVMLGATPVHTLARSSLLEELQHVSSDRILVLLQLLGGNDGLNTIVPVEDAAYYRARPRIAIPKHSALPLTNMLSLHPALRAVKGMYDEGQMAIVQSVGYPGANLSHFRSTDIWQSASNADAEDTTGWTGRHLERAYETFGTMPTPYPLAVQIGGLSPMLFQGNTEYMGMSVSNPLVFQRLVRTGRLYDESNIPNTVSGNEIAYVRRVANDAVRYGLAFQEAATRGRNQANYPDQNQNRLAYRLSLVARLIKGNLGTRVYHVGLNGFDTHGSQGGVSGNHARLLRYVAEAVQAFYADLAAVGRGPEVLVMTFSEFGRRVEQNGSGGTDHGAAAPLFLFGPGVQGGLFGQSPSLTDLDRHGNLKHGTDFRAVYASILQHWFGFHATTSASVLGASFNPLDLVRDPADPIGPTSTEPDDAPGTFVLQQNYPNPFRSGTSITYTVEQMGPVRLQVYDVQGRHVQTLVEGIRQNGSHSVSFEAQGLPNGVYFYRLESGGHIRSRQMTLLR